MYAKYSDIVEGNTKLKHHHHVAVDREFKDNCCIWVDFLQYQRSVSRPFVDFLSNELSSEHLFFFTDASKGESKGFGCVFGKHWTWGFWEKDYIKDYDPSIAYMELFALCMGIFVWADELRDVRIQIFCDNQSAVQMVNKLTSKCRNCMVLLRKLMLNNLQFNRRVFVSFVDTKSNFLADSLSRGQWNHFRKLSCNLQMDEKAEELLSELWPASKLWFS